MRRGGATKHLPTCVSCDADCQIQNSGCGCSWEVSFEEHAVWRIDDGIVREEPDYVEDITGTAGYHYPLLNGSSWNLVLGPEGMEATRRNQEPRPGAYLRLSRFEGSGTYAGCQDNPNPQAFFSSEQQSMAFQTGDVNPNYIVVKIQEEEENGCINGCFCRVLGRLGKPLWRCVGLRPAILGPIPDAHRLRFPKWVDPLHLLILPVSRSPRSELRPEALISRSGTRFGLLIFGDMQH